MLVNELGQRKPRLGLAAALGGGLLLTALISFAYPSLSHAANDDLATLLRMEENADSTVKSGTSGLSGVSISVDGETVVGSTSRTSRSDRNRSTDKSLEAVDIQVKFDGLDATRRLNISTADLGVSYRPGSRINFEASWNYPSWIDHAELRIFRQIDKYSGEVISRPLEVVRVPIRGENAGKAVWQSFGPGELFEEEDRNLVYTLRVYDSAGRFDETNPRPLILALPHRDDEEPREAVAPGEGDDNTAVSNIPLHGGVVTVYGRHVPPGYNVAVLGEAVPVDKSGAFVISRVLSPGEHLVDVSVTGLTKDDGLHFEREINIPDQDWFFVGLADLTVGKRIGEDSRALNEVTPGSYDPVYRRGRAAFYLKGRIKGDTLITAALDTTEEDLDVILSNLDEKDPRQLLRRLDPDDYYPVYGDDSTVVEDAPTSGRFYVRIERGKSHVLWGNFRTRINGTELARYERGLYGGHAHLKTAATTVDGEPVAEVEAFAAQPGTLPQRDEFRGTGGSAYFLRRQDINQGSEQVTIEERDPVTGIPVSRTTLRPGEDYELDYVQGVILLKKPLASATGTGSAVRDDALGGNDQYLVVVYEYTPTLEDVDGLTYGGRAQAWLGDYVRVGATGYVENTGIADQTLHGADVLVRMGEKSFLEVEWAQSRGDTFGPTLSTDGGFIFNPVTATNPGNSTAQAWRAKIAIDLEELTGGTHKGSIGGHYEEREAGFNAPGRYTSVRETIRGAYADLYLSEQIRLTAAYDEVTRGNGDERQEIAVEIRRDFNENISGRIGVLHSDQTVATGSTTGFGRRTDVGGRIDVRQDETSRVWLFGQLTVDRDNTRDRNDRIGVGGEKQITDKITASAEVSWGTVGIGGLAALNYSPNATDKYYLGYRLDPDTTAGDLNGYDPFGRDYGSIVFGANKRINDQLSAFFEENYDFTGTQRSLTHTYGVTYTPDATWTASAGVEAGEIYDDVNGDFERVAVSGTLSAREEYRSASLRLEARFENGINATLRDRNTYLLTASYSNLHHEDWRFIAKVDALISESDQGAVLDGDYVEASIGWAHRPVEHDRLNALFKYTYLHDLPGPQQVNANNLLLGPKQRSHVLSVDAIYDVTEKLSLGGKIGYRFGQVSTSRDDHDFQASSALLAIARADFHVVHQWDLFLEARALWLNDLDQWNYGVLAGVYRHLGDNLKLGIGYNFGRFSDDLTDLTLDDRGVFINLVGKF